MRWKKWFVILLLGLTTGTISAGTSYEVILLGDLHHDREEYHDPHNLPARYTPNTRKRNMAAEKLMPKLLKAAADKVVPATAFAIQLGDLIQGDGRDQNQHELMLNNAWKHLKTYFHIPVYMTVGNHDRRGNGAKEAFSAVMPGLFSREAGMALPESDFVIRQGEDVFIFVDSRKMRVDLKFLEKALADHADARYRFVLTHVPVIPLPAADDTSLFYHSEDMDDWHKLTDLLKQYDAIVLTGHLHRSAVVELDFGTEGKISQLMCFSMADAKVTTPTDVKKQTADYGVQEEGPGNRMVRQELLPYVKHFFQYRKPGGFVILKIDDNGVAAEFYCNWNRIPFARIELRHRIKTE